MKGDVRIEKQKNYYQSQKKLKPFYSQTRTIRKSNGNYQNYQYTAKSNSHPRTKSTHSSCKPEQMYLPMALPTSAHWS